MIVILCLLGAAVVFLAIVVALLYFQIVRPMREQIATQQDTIERNAGATIGLYTAHQRRLNVLSDKVEFVEAYAVSTLPKVEEAPITVRSERMKGVAA
jgi:flagellar biosynthesis/type III secretory pathway M-ring protein FliF/YscJ